MTDWNHMPFVTPAPFTASNTLDSKQKERLRAAMDAKGIRTLPYPFASAVAVVSDIDGSTRQRYDAYVGMLVGKLGLDFGDSIFLRRDGKEPSFLSNSLDMGMNLRPAVFTETRTLFENVAQFHTGNVDHFHAFSSHGPRVTIVDQLKCSEQGLHALIPPLDAKQTSSRERMPVLGVYLIASGSKFEWESSSIRVIDRRGRVTQRYRPSPVITVGNNECLPFLFDADPEDGAVAPTLASIGRIEVKCPPALAKRVVRILLANSPGPILIDRLRWLRDRFNVETSLVTEHSAFHFRNPRVAALHDQQLAEAVRDGASLLGLNGSLRDDEGELLFSTDADDPVSISRVLPELVDLAEVRFIVPVASGYVTGLDPLDLITPTGTRSGGGIYWARRVCPNLEPPLPGRKFDGTRTQHDTFAKRLKIVADTAAKSPGLCWPLYTHLGGGQSLQKGVPSPYFDPGPLHQVQDQVFNISGRLSHESRLWFCRASTIYDYSLTMRSLADQVSRTSANVIRIHSSLDHALDKRLPRSSSQLYGVTFYVDDPKKAQVWIDDEEVESLARNSADHTGRPSVTIAACDIRTIVFDRLDPLANGPHYSHCRSGSWRWCTDSDGSSYGRLTTKGDLATLALQLFGLQPFGAQHLTFRLRLAANSRFSIALTTRTGGLFYFGDRDLMSKFGDQVTAAYFFSESDRSPVHWQTLVAPFADLSWRAGCRPGGPMPNHEIKSISLNCSGDFTDFASLSFLRPRATTLALARDRHFCVVGSVPDFAAGQIVHLTSAAKDIVTNEKVDHRGFFAFQNVPAGIYRVWTTMADGSIRHSRRGLEIEVGANVPDIRLSARPESTSNLRDNIDGQPFEAAT